METAWLERLVTLPSTRTAVDLYGGRGSRLAREAAAAVAAPLYIVSAGLGLVAANREVPTYGVTVSDRGPDSVAARVVGRFDPQAWWSAVARSPLATPLSEAVGTERPLLIALTQPYARMLGAALDTLPDAAVGRLRIVGTKLQDVLPTRLRTQVLPYDTRLDAIIPGTRADFPHRALLHFAKHGLPTLPDADAAGHYEWVRTSLAERRAPERPQRPRQADAEILAVIESLLPSTHGIGRLLRRLREEEGIACEQARFSRLYRTALERRSTA